MRKIKLYTAISLNGKIARKNGDLEWLESLPNPDHNDYGFDSFYKSIDTTIQGYNTYKLILDRGIEIPSKDKKNYVITRKKDIDDTKYIGFINIKPINFIRDLKCKSGKDIWLIGGGQINTLLLNEDLIDEIQIFVMPIVIPDGIELFEHIPKEKMLKLMGTKHYPTGAVELKYRIEYK